MYKACHGYKLSADSQPEADINKKEAPHFSIKFEKLADLRPLFREES